MPAVSCGESVPWRPRGIVPVRITRKEAAAWVRRTDGAAAAGDGESCVSAWRNSAIQDFAAIIRRIRSALPVRSAILCRPSRRRDPDHKIARKLANLDFWGVPGHGVRLVGTPDRITRRMDGRHARWMTKSESGPTWKIKLLSIYIS